MLREACVETYNEIDAAAAAGVERIELCSRLDVGGFTPSGEALRYARGKGLAVAAMIRRREGFRFEPDQLPLLLADIRAMKEGGAEALVFGYVDYSGGRPRLDEAAFAALVPLCAPCQVVCHMAFDELSAGEQLRSPARLAALGVSRVLTKGGAGRAEDNVGQLRALRERAAEQRPPVTILCGGGVTFENYRQLERETGITEFHGRRICPPVSQ